MPDDMPDDDLQTRIRPILASANKYLASNKPDARKREAHLEQLKQRQVLISNDIGVRTTAYSIHLSDEHENNIIGAQNAIYQDPRYKEAYAAQNATNRQFEMLRMGGAYPRNISPAIYILPLILVGIAEWYVNFSTFSEIFIPVFAIAATVVVAAVFAWASHLHGAYVKQLSATLNPAVPKRNLLGRKIAIIIATVLLLAALSTVVWLRYLVVSEQLGIANGAEGGPFGETSPSIVWSKVGPTIIINILIWGLGTLYSWAMHEKIPDLRETYRDKLRADAAVNKYTSKLGKDEARLEASYEEKKRVNQFLIESDNKLLQDVDACVAALKREEAPT
jgi:hypothetical protein